MLYKLHHNNKAVEESEVSLKVPECPFEQMADGLFTCVKAFKNTHIHKHRCTFHTLLSASFDDGFCWFYAHFVAILCWVSTQQIAKAYEFQACYAYVCVCVCGYCADDWK